MFETTSATRASLRRVEERGHDVRGGERENERTNVRSNFLPNNGDVGFWMPEPLRLLARALQQGLEAVPHGEAHLQGQRHRLSTQRQWPDR